MRILFTGASSFTGFHFVKALADAGHELICPLRGTVAAYTGIRGARVSRLQPVARMVEGVSFGSESFLNLLRDSAPLDLLCHHAADVTNYKSSDFNPIRALQNNTQNLPSVLERVKSSGGKAVLLTGTIFEPDEGRGERGEGRGKREEFGGQQSESRGGTAEGRGQRAEGSTRAFSPYGLSKGLTWQMFRYYCEVADVPLGKFVLPNPFGPFEEPRFTSYLMTNWKAGKSVQVKTPDYIRDNCHVSLLALAYAAFASRLGSVSTATISTNPSGYVETQGEFTARLAREVSSRTKWPCQFDLFPQQDFSEPLVRFNTEPATPQFPQWSESAAWDEFVNFYS